MTDQPKHAGGRPTFIYGLIDPNTDEVRYVGKSDNPERRYREHCRASNNRTSTPRCNWLCSLLNEGKVPRLVLFEMTNDWNEAERRWIELYRNDGARLTNVADGGMDLSHARRARTKSRYSGRHTPLQKLRTMFRAGMNRQGSTSEHRATCAESLSRLSDAERQMGRDVLNALLEEHVLAKRAA